MKNVFIKRLAIGIIILFLVIRVLPDISGNNEKLRNLSDNMDYISKINSKTNEKQDQWLNNNIKNKVPDQYIVGFENNFSFNKKISLIQSLNAKCLDSDSDLNMMLVEVNNEDSRLINNLREKSEIRYV